jgi:hypothetical protein
MQPHGALPGPARLSEMIWSTLQFLLDILLAQPLA